MDYNTLDLLNAALAYRQRGWSVFPANTNKKPAIRGWKEYQATAADDAQLRAWFFNGRYPALAVIFGTVSGGLACRDFDLGDDYTAWMEQNTELALTLPTVKTLRGYHVYFLCPGCQVRKLGKSGELRGEGSYCILPPSPHPKGSYHWMIRLTETTIPTIDPAAVGLIPPEYVTEETPVTEESYESSISSEEPNDTQEDEVIAGEGGSGRKPIILEPLQTDIARIIAETVPKQYGTRDDFLFKFARRLRSLPGCWDADPEQFLSVLREWYQRALPNITTKSFEENRIDFLYKWTSIKSRKGQRMESALEKVKQCRLDGLTYESDRVQELVKLCKVLQEQAGSDPFFLSTRTVASLFGIEPMTAHRWLWMLERDKWIRAVKRGNVHGQATRYRFIGRNPGPGGSP